MKVTEALTMIWNERFKGRRAHPIDIYLHPDHVKEMEDEFADPNGGVSIDGNKVSILQMRVIPDPKLARCAIRIDEK